MIVISHIPLEHCDVSHFLAPTQISPLNAPTQSSDDNKFSSINTDSKK